MAIYIAMNIFFSAILYLANSLSHYFFVIKPQQLKFIAMHFCVVSYSLKLRKRKKKKEGRGWNVCVGGGILILKNDVLVLFLCMHKSNKTKTISSNKGSAETSEAIICSSIYQGVKYIWEWNSHPSVRDKKIAVKWLGGMVVVSTFVKSEYPWR